MALHAPIPTPVHADDQSTCAAPSEQPSAYRFWKLRPVQKLQHHVLKKLDTNEPASPDQSPTPDPSSLSDYIESHQDRVLQFDKNRRQIGWQATSDSLLDDYYADISDDRPYEPPHPQSRRIKPRPTNATTRHANLSHVHFPIPPRTHQGLFRVCSSLADEGIVGIVYLWKWVKRMIVHPYWQNSVWIAPIRPGPDGTLEWYTLGISAGPDVTTMRFAAREWTVSTPRLLQADLEITSPHDWDTSCFAIPSVFLVARGQATGPSCSVETTPFASETPPTHGGPSSSEPTSSLLSSPPCFTMYIPARIRDSAPNGVHHKRSRPSYLSSTGHLPRKKTSKTVKSFIRAAGKIPIQPRGPSGKGDGLSAVDWVESDMETSDEGNEEHICCE